MAETSLEALKKEYLDESFELKSRFSEGSENHEETLTRCETYAGWTIPHLFPRDDINEQDEMQYDYQSLGAQATTHLANKIMLALFVPAQPFFRNDLTDEQRAEAKKALRLDDAKIDEMLAKAERQGMKRFNSSNNRACLTDVMMLLIITGNALVHRDKKENYMRYWTLRDYQVKRNVQGHLREVIFREKIKRSALDDELAALAEKHGYKNETDDLTIYTCIKSVGKGRYFVWQELEDVAYVHKQVGVYNKDNLPWFVLTWNLARGKDYGTGLVENYSGAFHMLSHLTEAVKDYATIITDIKTLVDPAGATDATELAESESGAYVPGREEDLHVHSPEVRGNAEFIEQRIDKLERQIAAAFLMQSSVVRDAERVTATEIRQQIFELESSFGGVYGRLAHELQLPLAKRLMREIDEVFKDIEPIVTTGLEALSRTGELDRIRAFMQDLVVLSDIPPEVADRVNYEGLISMLGAGHQIEYQKILLDNATVEANRSRRAEEEAQSAGLEAGAVAAAQGTVNG